MSGHLQLHLITHIPLKMRMAISSHINNHIEIENEHGKVSLKLAAFTRHHLHKEIFHKLRNSNHDTAQGQARVLRPVVRD